jgi:uncharacterized damage-inducible protein DinB
MTGDDHPHGKLAAMTEYDPKADLRRYLQTARDALLWKLEGLSEYDIRRPMTPTGTNLLGLVKHAATAELEYFGRVFGRPSDMGSPWDDESDPNGDLYAQPDESREDIIEFYRRTQEHANATIEALDLDSPGRVPWWGENGEVTLFRILVHVTAELHHHAGHADIVRELIDGAAGLRRDNSNLPDVDETYWPEYRDRLEAIAKEAS